MDSRERTFLSLSHQVPDRIPIDPWVSAGFREKLERSLGAPWERLLDDWDVDLRYIPGPAYVGPPLRTFPGHMGEDIWGVRREIVALEVGGGREIYQEVRESPLAEVETAEEILNYPGWPSPDWFEYREIESQCEAIRREGRVAVFMGDRLNRVSQLKPAMYLRGVERIFEDMILRPDLVRALLSRIRDFYLAYSERIYEAANGKLDLLLMGDDFGSQNGPLVSPAMWVDFLGEGFSGYVGLAKSHRIRVMHHTCGAVRPIIPLMLGCGLDVLQSLQPEAAGMGAAGLKQEFGRDLAFHGGVSIQRTMPFGSPREVREEVRAVVESLAPGGGYIGGTSHNVQADAPVGNFLEFLSAFREFGRYR